MQSQVDLIARARLTNLVGTLAEGTPLVLLRPELQRHGLGISLTEREAEWFSGDDVPDANQSWQLEAMMALAWVLGFAASLGPHDPEAYGPIQNALDEKAPRELVLRDEGEVRAMLESIEQLLATGEAPPPDEEHERDGLLWRRRALRWALGVDSEWQESRRWC